MPQRLFVSLVTARLARENLFHYLARVSPASMHDVISEREEQRKERGANAVDEKSRGRNAWRWEETSEGGANVEDARKSGGGRRVTSHRGGG